MTVKQVAEHIAEAFESSTMSDNRFASAVFGIRWDCNYSSEDGHFFEFGGLTLVTDGLDPFDMDWRPYFLVGSDFIGI